MGHPRRLRVAGPRHKVRQAQKHRRSGAHAGFTKRIRHKLFRGRMVNAPRLW